MDALSGQPAMPALPAQAPLPMPRQKLWSHSPVPRLRAHFATKVVRFAVIGSAIALSAGGAFEMFEVLNVGGLTTLETLVLCLFVALFAWIALAFTSALSGFLAAVLARERQSPLPPLTTTTAILMPVYNESPARFAAAMEAMDTALQEQAAGDAFHFFILSDTTDPDIWIAEEQAFLALRQRTGGERRIFYRRRPHNIERKAGNIADWVTRFGGAYEHVLILDADSVMTGQTILRLVAAMEADPRVGLVQTLPILVGGRTLFGRLQQFASRIYGPLVARGITTWHGNEGNYWGHNAIIRTRAFAEAAGLPHISGRKPFGGHVLSHDFVEAALLRRAGWAIRMVPGWSGSYEEGPPTLTELAVRDRRWCQGNLQHAAILPARGLHWISRLHLLMGIGSYTTAPMWFAFLCLGILIALQARFILPQYFPSDFTLYPLWPAQDPVRAMWVFAGTMGLLVVPKLLAFFVALFDRHVRRGSGGGLRLFAGVLLETVLTGLLAPITMLSQSASVVSIVLGRDAGWQPQQREGGKYPLSVIVRAYWWHTAVGLGLGIASYAVSPALFLWMSPVILSLAFTIPLVRLVNSRHLATVLDRFGLLRTPEEWQPPPELERSMQLRRLYADIAFADRDAVAQLADDPALLQAHLQMLPTPRQPGDPIDVPLLVARTKIAEAPDCHRAVGALTRQEKVAALADAETLRQLLTLAGKGGMGTLSTAEGSGKPMSSRGP
jgi:membrane glycosyltransferase